MKIITSCLNSYPKYFYLAVSDVIMNHRVEDFEAERIEHINTLQFLGEFYPLMIF